MRIDTVKRRILKINEIFLFMKNLSNQAASLQLNKRMY